MADEDADYADEDDYSEDDEKLQRVEEHSGSTEYLSTEDEGEAGAPAAGAVFASGLDALMSAADAMPSEPLEHRTRGLADRRPRGRPPRPTPYDDDGIRKCAACGTTSTPKWRCAMTLLQDARSLGLKFNHFAYSHVVDSCDAAGQGEGEDDGEADEKAQRRSARGGRRW